MKNYYNECDKDAAAWLRNLIAAKLIPDGDVDERSIEDVIPNELRGYTQHHFFAGIAGWSLALDLAGWPRDRPVWTGSCPCQPFSAAGKGDGFKDERHLWPAFQHLIAQCRPPVVFGEQVASKATDAWVDLVHADLENLGYAFGCIPFSAASIGAPHIRDRNYWVANANDAGLEGRQRVQQRADKRSAGPRGMARGLANPDGWNAGTERQQCGGEQRQQPQDAGVDGLADMQRLGHAAVQRGGDSRLASRGDSERAWTGLEPGRSVGWPSPPHGFWRDADWIKCRDGKWRPVEPGTFPLAHGVPGRVVRLRAYGNSIVPQAAAAFVGAYMAGEMAQEMAA